MTNVLLYSSLKGLSTNLENCLLQAGIFYIKTDNLLHLGHLLKQELGQIVIIIGKFTSPDIAYLAQEFTNYDQNIFVILLNHLQTDLKQSALSLGFNEYFNMPFSHLKLIHLIASLAYQNMEHYQEFSVGQFKIDRLNYVISYQEQIMKLTIQQFRLLNTLLERLGRNTSRNVLAEAIWGFEKPINLQSVDAAVHRLRKRLPISLSRAIESVYGLGYRFNPELLS